LPAGIAGGVSVLIFRMRKRFMDFANEGCATRAQLCSASL
jgi:hypothetical protein